MPQQFITTSWDDGHELDFKLAERLNNFGLKGTFYIPKTNAERQVMSEKAVQELSTDFEIGGHTLNHVRLKGLTHQTVKYEVEGCRDWLFDLIGEAPQSFCFPGGLFDSQSRRIVTYAGFKLARTTELFSLNNTASLAPTTLQLYPHSGTTYLKHLIKRQLWQSLIGWMKANSATDLIKLTEYYLQQLQLIGGCFHLWGHSWEIEEYNLWSKVDAVFSVLSSYQEAQFVTNAGLLQDSIQSSTFRA